MLTVAFLWFELVEFKVKRNPSPARRVPTLKRLTPAGIGGLPGDVTPLKQVASPTWGLLPSCKLALTLLSKDVVL